MGRIGTNGPLPAILGLALVLRVAVAILLPSVAHPDETFQYIEQAYRVVSGRGVVPWEYVVGVRSWAIPGLLIPFAAVGHWLSPQPDLYLGAVAALMIGLSLSSVAAAWFIAKAYTRGDTASAVMAALLVAVWPEILLFAPHVLADSLSGATLIAGLALAAPRTRTRGAQVVAAGLLLGLTVALRIQLAPAVGVAVLSLAAMRFRAHILVFGVALAAPVLAFGLVDWITWGAPFYSIFVNLRANAGGVADSFSVSPWSGYLTVELAQWSLPVGALILVTAALGAWRARLPAAVLVTVIATFSIVAHKEYRFIYPALPLLACLCGVGTASLVEHLRRLMRRARPSAPQAWIARGARLPVAAALLWLAAAIWVGLTPSMRLMWTQDRGVLQALAAINHDPKSCGVAVDPPGAWGSVALARLRAGLPLYAAPTDDTPSSATAYNYMLQPGDYDPNATPDNYDYALVRCFGDKSACLYKREGTCTPPAGLPLTPVNLVVVEKALLRTGIRPVVNVGSNPYAWRPPVLKK